MNAQLPACLLFPLPPLQAVRPLLGVTFLSASISPGASLLWASAYLGLALSIVPCVVLIRPLHGVGFMVSAMLLSEKPSLLSGALVVREHSGLPLGVP